MEMFEFVALISWFRVKIGAPTTIYVGLNGAVTLTVLRGERDESVLTYPSMGKLLEAIRETMAEDPKV